MIKYRCRDLLHHISRRRKMLRVVKTENGWVRGIPAADPRITTFKGIPFAKPPVGDLRWRAPQPAEDWKGIRDCYTFGNIAMQEVPSTSIVDRFYTKEWHVDPDLPMGEDCLNLNIWTPAMTGDEKFPVMVLYYGGALNVGYPSEMELDGERIARRGVILVSVNYRVNVFGFMCHPEITAESPDAPANFGHLDQRFGVEWVKRNIAAFGGDPENITVFGQSAGAGSTVVQMCSPMNKGLFQKAIPMSGGGFLPPSNMGMTLPEAEKLGKALFEALGVSSLEEARKVDAKTLWEVAMGDKLKTFGFRWGTVVDYKFLPDYPVRLLMRGEYNHMPIMMGNTRGEFPVTVNAQTKEDFEEYVRDFYGKFADDILRITEKDTDDIEQIRANARHNGFRVGNYLWLDSNVENGYSPMYYYEFDPEIPGDNAGSFHSSELWFVFETLAKCWRPFKGKHYDLARMMCNYWTNFAKTGDPNGKDADGTDMPEWKPVSADYREAMFFGDETIGMTEDMRTELEEVLIKYYMDQLENGELPSVFKTAIRAAIGNRKLSGDGVPPVINSDVWPS